MSGRPLVMGGDGPHWREVLCLVENGRRWLVDDLGRRHPAPAGRRPDIVIIDDPVRDPDPAPAPTPGRIPMSADLARLIMNGPGAAAPWPRQYGKRALAAAATAAAAPRAPERAQLEARAARIVQAIAAGRLTW